MPVGAGERNSEGVEADSDEVAAAARGEDRVRVYLQQREEERRRDERETRGRRAEAHSRERAEVFEALLANGAAASGSVETRASSREHPRGKALRWSQPEAV